MQFGVEPQEFTRYLTELINQQLVDHYYLVNRLVKNEEKIPINILDMLPTGWKKLVNTINKGDYGAIFTFQHIYLKPEYYQKYQRFIIEDITSNILGIFKLSKDKTKTLKDALDNLVYPRVVKELDSYILEDINKQDILYAYTLLIALSKNLDIEVFEKETLKKLESVSSILGFVHSNLYDILNWQLFPFASLLSLMNISNNFKDYRVVAVRLYYVVLDILKNVLETFESSIDAKEYDKAQRLMMYTGPLTIYSFNVVPYESQNNQELERLHTSLVYSDNLKTWSEYFIKVVKELAKTTDPIIPLRPALKAIDKAYWEVKNALKQIEDFYS